METSPDVLDRIAKLLPRLASEHDGEVVATARAIRRTLTSAGLDLHDLAKALATPKAPSVAGHAPPRPDPAPRPPPRPDWGGTAGWWDRHETGTRPDYGLRTIEAMVAELYLRIGQMTDWERVFVKSMASATRLKRKLTDRQISIVRDLYRKYGG